jgi:AI-2 transport protein TqsA
VPVPGSDHPSRPTASVSVPVARNRAAARYGASVLCSSSRIAALEIAMWTKHQISLQHWLLGFIALGIGLFILVAGRFFLMPLAIAILLFSLISAAIARISRLRIGSVEVPDWLASVVVLFAIGLVLLMISGIMANQINVLVASAPVYWTGIQRLIEDMSGWVGGDVAAGIFAVVGDIDLVGYLRPLAGSAGYVAGTTILIILYVGFLLAERGQFAHKLGRIFASPGQADEVERIFDSITRNVHRYILIKTLVSALTGALTFVVLRLVGLEFAETWAMLTFFLNFIPNIGSIAATLILTLVAFFQFDGWGPVLVVFGVIGAIQFLIGNVIEPSVMGRSLRLSSFVIILSLTFWGAVWGIIGMFLAVPIMVMIMIVCSHVPALRSVAILMSREGETVEIEKKGLPLR